MPTRRARFRARSRTDTNRRGSHRYTPGIFASSFTASIDTGSTVASDRSNRCTS